jgi:phage portal protein BeeE
VTVPKLWSSLLGRDEKRYGITDWNNDMFQQFGFNGHQYPITGWGQPSNLEDVEHSFQGYVQAAYKSNGIIFGLIEARRLVFSEARFQFQHLRAGTPGDLFDGEDLALLARPWPNGTTGELLSRMEQDVSLAGNFYAVREGKRLRRLRPDWVSIVLTAPPEEAVQSDVQGYIYKPGGAMSKAEPQAYSVEEVAHWSPIPDPEAQYRGMSWIAPVIREIQSDKLATEHKAKFFDAGASPKIAVTFKETTTIDQFREFMEAYTKANTGMQNVYKPMFFGGGADVTTVGADLKQLDFKVTQGAGETRLAVAARVPAVLAGISEGLAGSSLNAGNFSVAKRSFADGFLRPQWRSAAAALAHLVRVPAGARLWYADQDIPFLYEDAMDAAEILSRRMLTIESGVRAGFEPKSVVATVDSADLRLLEHTGLYSVQLQPPGTAAKPPEPTAPAEAPADDEDEDDGNTA